MKKILSLILLLIACTTSRAYVVSNDLGSPFTLSYWTNSSGSYSFSLVSNVTAASLYVPVVSTNGNAGLAISPTNATVTLLIEWTNMPYASNLVSSMFTNALAAVAPPLETVPQLQTILKSYYITGSVPTEADYWELIDTMFWYANFMYQNMNIAVSNATFVAGIVQQNGPSFTTEVYCTSTAAAVGNSASTNIDFSYGFTNMTMSSFNDSDLIATYQLTNYFAAPISNPLAHLEVYTQWGSHYRTPVTTFGMTSNYVWISGVTNVNDGTTWSNLLVVRVFN